MRIRSAMDPIVEKAVKGKKLALFRDTLEHYKYPDPGILDELIDGASLIGEVANTGMLPFKFTPALWTTEALHSQSSFRRQQILEEQEFG